MANERQRLGDVIAKIRNRADGLTLDKRYFRKLPLPAPASFAAFCEAAP